MLNNSYPVITRLFLCLIFPLILLVILFFLYLRQSLPQTKGIVNVKSISAPVKIIREKNAISHIFANTDKDAFFAIGYVHAQERMWQMEYQRRLGQGRLSEILGLKALPSDQVMRTLGIYSAAKTALASLDSSTQESLLAYSEGVNTWIKENHILPIEYIMLGFKPELWKPEDSVLQVKLMALDLGQNFHQELMFDLLVKELGLKKASELIPEYPSASITVTQASEKINPIFQYNFLMLANVLQNKAVFGSSGIGSNAWVVSGSTTASGKPLLAADPHLANTIPSTWYLLEVHGENLHVTGATFPGVPYVIFGHNDSIAWGGTSLTADVQDLYVEKLNPLDENQYEDNGQWKDIDITEEWIKIKSDFPTFLTTPIPALKWSIRKTRHGPLISDALGRIDYPLSLRWTALDKTDHSIESLYKINLANDWSAFKSAINNYSAPALNYIYADTQGNIGYLSAGKIPIRKKGDGKLPAPGWQSEFDWAGYIPVEEMPQSFNPESGAIISANNKVHNSDYPYLISNSWSPPYRAERIAEIINQHIKNGDKLTTDNFIKMQGDQRSLFVKNLQSFFNHLTPKTPQQKEIIERLIKWDGILSENSSDTAIFQSWLRNFNESLLKDDLKSDLLHIDRGDKLQDFVQQLHPQLISQVLNINSNIYTNQWCDKIHTTIHESCDELALSAIDEAIRELKRYSGINTQWGEIHKTLYAHPIFTHVQLLDSIFDRNVKNGGDSETINVASWKYSQDKGYQQIVGPSYRQVIDLSAWNKSGFINNTGQSGNIFSPHYDDYIELHKNLNLLPMVFDKEWRNLKGEILLLKPAL